MGHLSHHDSDRDSGREAYAHTQSRVMVLQLEFQVVALHHGLHQAEAEPIARSGTALFKAEKALEDLLPLGFRDARSAVTQAQSDRVPVVFQDQLDAARGGGGLEPK